MADGGWGGGLQKLEQVVIRHVRLQLRTPFVTALGVEHGRDILIVEVHADGVIGYGEVPVLSAPTYNEETVETAWHVLNDFFVERGLLAPAPGDDGEAEALTPQAVARRLAGFKGHAFAKAGLEGAVWDATAKAADVGLAALLHRWSTARDRPRRERIASGVVLGVAGHGTGGQVLLLDQVGARVREGYRRIKLKIAPGRDVAYLQAVRRAFPDIALAVDANGTYRWTDVEQLRALDAFGLAYIEQPLRAGDVIDHGKLQRLLTTPICLDESIRGAEEAAQALTLPACRVVNVKPSRLGGLTEAVALHDLCVAHDTGALVGGLLESGIGRAHLVALAALPGFGLPGDVSASARYWVRDVIHPPFELDPDGHLPVPPGPGIGVEVDRPYLEEMTVRRRVHRPGTASF